MENLYNNKSGSIIIVEGFWGVGKSTLISKICKQYNLKYITEPDHKDFRVKKDISEWYRAEHNRRLKDAQKQSTIGHSTIIERSILANIAFYYAENGRLPVNYEETLKDLGQIGNLYIVFLLESRNDCLSHISSGIKSISIRRRVISNNLFYSRYIHFYSSILSKSLGRKMILIEHEKNNSGLDARMYAKLRKLLDRLCEKLKDATNTDKQVCAGGVIIYENKCLVLYDHKYKHLVFPQGHLLNGEIPSNAARREITEETGFYDLKLLFPIRKYSYGYKQNKRIVYKTTHMFAFLLQSLRRHKKKLEAHEKYSNRFMTIDKAINKLRWSDDKFILAKLIGILNKKDPASQ